jgi:hypothetical protein
LHESRPWSFEGILFILTQHIQILRVQQILYRCNRLSCSLCFMNWLIGNQTWKTNVRCLYCLTIFLRQRT